MPLNHHFLEVFKRETDPCRAGGWVKELKSSGAGGKGNQKQGKGILRLKRWWVGKDTKNIKGVRGMLKNYFNAGFGSIFREKLPPRKLTLGLSRG